MHVTVVLAGKNIKVTERFVEVFDKRPPDIEIQRPDAYGRNGKEDEVFMGVVRQARGISLPFHTKMDVVTQDSVDVTVILHCILTLDICCEKEVFEKSVRHEVSEIMGSHQAILTSKD